MIKKLMTKLTSILMAAVLLTACSGNIPSPSPTTYNTPDPQTSATAEPSTPEPATPSPVEASATPEPTPAAEATPAPEKGTPVKVKAVYLSGYVAAAKLDHFIELVNKTELNALVIDIKEAGAVNYLSEVPMVKELGLGKKIYDPVEVLKKCHDNNIYVIGRIVAFRDNGLATQKPQYAVKTPSGTAWKEGKQGSWTNPYITEVQDYNIEIAKEAVSLGFDEIQFDYVRFPTAKASEVSYGDNVPEKTATIAQFVKRAAEEIKKVRNVPVSADLFGIIAESEKDGKTIGQQVEIIGQYIDIISPMVYPSHYANNAKRGAMSNGVGQKVNGVLFTHPDLQPYDVVYQTLLKVKERLSSEPNCKAKVRPYLQDFTADYLPTGYWQTYGVDQVRAQIKAVYDAGYDEWILWSGKNKYTEAAPLPEAQ